MPDKDKPIQEIYEFYCQTFGKNPNRYKLLPERRRKIAARLKEFSMDEIKKAITNLSQSAFHVDNGYVGLDFVLRNSGKTEEWVEKLPETLRRQNRLYLKQNPSANIPFVRPVQQKQETSEYEQTLSLQARAEEVFQNLSYLERERRIAKKMKELSQDPRIKGRGWDQKTLRTTAEAGVVDDIENELADE